MGAQPKPQPEDYQVKTGAIAFEFIAYPRNFNRNKRKLTFGPLARTILEEIWDGTQGAYRPKGAPAPEYALLTLRDFVAAENYGKPKTAKEIQSLLSTAHTAVQDLVKRKVISRLTAAQAQALGLDSHNSQSRWYKCNWQTWDKLDAPDKSAYEKEEKPTAVDQEPTAEKVIPIRADARRPVKADKPLAWQLAPGEDPVKGIKLLLPTDGFKAAIRQNAGDVTVQVIENKDDRLRVDPKAKGPAQEQPPHTAPAAGGGDGDTERRPSAKVMPSAADVYAARIKECMAELRIPITEAEAKQAGRILVGALTKTPKHPLEIEWFCTLVRQRDHRERLAGRSLTFPVLLLIAKDAIQKWPDEVRGRTAGAPSATVASDGLSPASKLMQEMRRMKERR